MQLLFPKAVLFDFDGVIVDSESSHEAAWMLAFEQIFNKPISDFTNRNLAGKAPIEIAHILAEFGGDITQAHKLNDLKQELLFLGEATPALLPGVKEMVGFLKNHKIPHGIASNAYTSFITKVIEKTQGGIEVCMGVDLFTEPKPSPIPYLTLAEKLEVNKKDFKQTYIFEDSITGIKAAVQTGMIPIGLLTQHSEEVLKQHGAVKVYPTLLEAFEDFNKFKNE